MTAGRRAARRFEALLVASFVVGGAVGCGPAAPTGPGPSPAPSRVRVAGDPSLPATSAGTPAATGSDEADCPIAGARIALPLDRVVDLSLGPGPGSDSASFILGGTGAAAGSRPRAELSLAAPPFSRGGQAIDLGGHRFLEIRFVGVATRDPSGAAAFGGDRDVETELSALRQLTVVEETDGLIAWDVGLDGPGCVSFALDPGGDRVILTVAHARG